MWKKEKITKDDRVNWKPQGKSLLSGEVKSDKLYLCHSPKYFTNAGVPKYFDVLFIRMQTFNLDNPLRKLKDSFSFMFKLYITAINIHYSAGSLFLIEELY